MIFLPAYFLYRSLRLVDRQDPRKGRSLPWQLCGKDLNRTWSVLVDCLGLCVCCVFCWKQHTLFAKDTACQLLLVARYIFIHNGNRAVWGWAFLTFEPPVSCLARCCMHRAQEASLLWSSSLKCRLKLQRAAQVTPLLLSQTILLCILHSNKMFDLRSHNTCRWAVPQS